MSLSEIKGYYMSRGTEMISDPHKFSKIQECAQ